MMQKIKKAMGKRGVAMVEYAILLAFVCIVAAVYMSDGGLKGGISSRIEKTVSVLNTDTATTTPTTP